MDKQAYEHLVGMVLSKEAGWWDGSWYNAILNWFRPRPKKMHDPNLDINTIPASRMNIAAGRKILSNDYSH